MTLKSGHSEDVNRNSNKMCCFLYLRRNVVLRSSQFCSTIRVLELDVKYLRITMSTLKLIVHVDLSQFVEQFEMFRNTVTCNDDRILKLKV